MMKVRKFLTEGKITRENSIWDWLTNATLGAAMADAPAITTATGWSNNSGKVSQDKNALDATKRPDLAQLRNTLATIGAVTTAGTAAPVILPLLAPGTVGGNFIGTMALGEGVNEASRSTTGNSWGDNVYNAVASLTPKDWHAPLLALEAGHFAADLTNPGYIFAEPLAGIASKIELPTFNFGRLVVKGRKPYVTPEAKVYSDLPDINTGLNPLSNITSPANAGLVTSKTSLNIATITPLPDLVIRNVSDDLIFSRDGGLLLFRDAVENNMTLEPRYNELLKQVMDDYTFRVSRQGSFVANAPINLNNIGQTYAWNRRFLDGYNKLKEYLAQRLGLNMRFARDNGYRTVYRGFHEGTVARDANGNIGNYLLVLSSDDNGAFASFNGGNSGMSHIRFWDNKNELNPEIEDALLWILHLNRDGTPSGRLSNRNYINNAIYTLGYLMLANLYNLLSHKLGRAATPLEYIKFVDKLPEGTIESLMLSSHGGRYDIRHRRGSSGGFKRILKLPIGLGVAATVGSAVDSPEQPETYKIGGIIKRRIKL